MIGSPEKKFDKTKTRRTSFQCNLLFFYTTWYKIKQASDAGVSRQCLEDKMSKGARNVDIGKFDI